MERIIYEVSGVRRVIECDSRPEMVGTVRDIRRQGLTIIFAGRARDFAGFGRIVAQVLSGGESRR